MTTEPQPRPSVIVDGMSAVEWNAIARQLGALYTVTYDQRNNTARFLSYDPQTGQARPLEVN